MTRCSTTSRRCSSHPTWASKPPSRSSTASRSAFPKIKEEIAGLLLENDLEKENDFVIPEMDVPYIILVVGVNGVGKTTTIGKLAYQFKKNGYSVTLGAADTFRAAAIDQLKEWGNRCDVPVVAQKMGSDPAAVAFDTVKSAIANHSQVVIIDTAGRLHNKINLMNELVKIKNVIRKLVPEGPHEVLLVLDGSTGQNAFEQAKQFTAATEVNALAITSPTNSRYPSNTSASARKSTSCRSSTASNSSIPFSPTTGSHAQNGRH